MRLNNMVCDENASKWNAPKWNRAKVGHVKLGQSRDMYLLVDTRLCRYTFQLIFFKYLSPQNK